MTSQPTQQQPDLDLDAIEARTKAAARGLPTGEERISVRDELADFYRAGSTLLELSSRTGRSYWAVRTLLLEAGVQLREPGGSSGGRRARKAA